MMMMEKMWKYLTFGTALGINFQPGRLNKRTFDTSLTEYLFERSLKLVDDFGQMCCRSCLE